MAETRAAAPTVNIKFKARLFEMVFSEKRELLELYNAVNGSKYDDPEQLTINTLENAIYMSMHNDISFVFDMRLSLYEHQSTKNPNLPLRFLNYIADLYSAMTKGENLYGEKMIPIPTPEFYIFYNGREKAADRTTLRLSDLYMVKEESYKLELEATMLNINRGHNPELLNACKTLKDYAEFIARIRDYADEMASIEEAVERAVTECIQEGILAEFLGRYRAEVIKVCLYEYDQEEHMALERRENFEKGVEQGIEQGIKQGLEQGLEQGMKQGIEQGIKLTREALYLKSAGREISEIAEKLQVSEEQIREMLEIFDQ